ncbi:hypothetical protein BC834DRAFT_869688 [Gloeopeniophorella convolvens]|nr:hypothetical protein BC834DRAFT_869688 [Gloeopeniophorella convolvens]
MSLLSPSESHAFQSFLSSIDYDYSLVESVVASAEWSSLSDDIPVPHAGPDKEALAKATKSLMALPQPVPSSSSLWEATDIRDVAFFKQPRTVHGAASGSHPLDAQDGSVSRNQFDHLQSIVTNARPQPSPHLAPLRSHRPSASASSSSSTVTNFPGPSHPSSSKRAFSEDSSSSCTSHKRLRPSSSRASASTPSTAPSQPVPGGKPALLSASQKKANHIQSEQKRRANIRRGYEALCETIPALREAIRAEEEASNGAGTGSKRRRTRGRIDGRAGPRSENIVLAKTVEHIQDLLAQRQQLVDRLQRARAMLPPGHPAQGLALPPEEVPLWEREWNGGMDDKDDDDAGDASGDDDDP